MSKSENFLSAVWQRLPSSIFMVYWYKLVYCIKCVVLKVYFFDITTVTLLFCPQVSVWKITKEFLVLRPTEIFAKRTMASICGRMALRAAARQNVAYTPVRFCKSKCAKSWREIPQRSSLQPVTFAKVCWPIGGDPRLELHNYGVAAGKHQSACTGTAG